MRTRSRNLTQTVGVDWSWTSLAGDSGIQATTYSVCPGEEDIYDDDQPAEVYEKPVLHKWTKFERLPCPQIPLMNNSGEAGFNPGQLTTNKFGWFLAEYRQGPGPVSFPDLSLAGVPLELKQRALINLLPKVNDGLSAINFLLELKDLRRMFDIRTLERVADRIRGYHKIGSSGRRGLTHKDLANDFLNYQFGWKPFVADILACIKALKGLDQRVKYLEAHAGRVLRRNISYDLDLPSVPSTGYWDTPHATYAGSNTLRVLYETRYDRWEYRPRYHATLIYRYTIPQGVGPVRRKIRAFLDAFGVRFDPSIIWNAIPFSFVVDWFVDVGSFLRTFAPTDLGMEVSVIDFSHSVKWQHTGETRLWQAKTSTGHNIGDSDSGVEQPVLAKRTTSYYERARDIPDLYAISGAIPNLLQASLGGALVIGSSKARRKYGGRPSRFS